jgi:hypothetical protein
MDTTFAPPYPPWSGGHFHNQAPATSHPMKAEASGMADYELLPWPIRRLGSTATTARRRRSCGGAAVDSKRAVLADNVLAMAQLRQSRTPFGRFDLAFLTHHAGSISLGASTRLPRPSALRLSDQGCMMRSQPYPSTDWRVPLLAERHAPGMARLAVSRSPQMPLLMVDTKGTCELGPDGR